jgi:hypothetical protein
VPLENEIFNRTAANTSNLTWVDSVKLYLVFFQAYLAFWWKNVYYGCLRRDAEEKFGPKSGERLEKTV